MDSDEFIAALDDGGEYSADAALVLRRFATLPRTGHKYKFHQVGTAYCAGVAGAGGGAASESGSASATAGSDGASPPARTGRRVADATFLSGHGVVCDTKTFFLASTYVMTDLGNHRGMSTADGECDALLQGAAPDAVLQCPPDGCFHTDTRLALVHYGDETSMTWEAYRRKNVRGFALHGAAGSNATHYVCAGGFQFCDYMARVRDLGEEGARAWFDARRAEQCGQFRHVPAIAEALHRAAEETGSPGAWAW